MASLGARAASPAPLGWPSGRRSRKALPCGDINYLKSATTATMGVSRRRCVESPSSRPGRGGYSPLNSWPLWSVGHKEDRLQILRNMLPHQVSREAASAARNLHTGHNAGQRAEPKENHRRTLFGNTSRTGPKSGAAFVPPLHGPFVTKTYTTSTCGPQNGSIIRPPFWRRSGASSICSTPSNTLFGWFWPPVGHFGGGRNGNECTHMYEDKHQSLQHSTYVEHFFCICNTYSPWHTIEHS